MIQKILEKWTASLTENRSDQRTKDQSLPATVAYRGTLRFPVNVREKGKVCMVRSFVSLIQPSNPLLLCSYTIKQCSMKEWFPWSTVNECCCVVAEWTSFPATTSCSSWSFATLLPCSTIVLSRENSLFAAFLVEFFNHELSRSGTHSFVNRCRNITGRPWP